MAKKSKKIDPTTGKVSYVDGVVADITDAGTAATVNTGFASGEITKNGASLGASEIVITDPSKEFKTEAANNGHNLVIANTTQAEAGTDDDKVMTPLRTKESITANETPVSDSISFSTDSNPCAKKTNSDTTFTAAGEIGYVIYRGSDDTGAPQNIKVVLKADSSDNITVEVIDKTNADAVICSKMIANASTLAIYDLGGISNVPTAEALFLIRFKRQSAGTTVLDVYSATMQY